jgi:hypothetical protein
MEAWEDGRMDEWSETVQIRTNVAQEGPAQISMSQCVFAAARCAKSVETLRFEI